MYYQTQRVKREADAQALKRAGLGLSLSVVPVSPPRWPLGGLLAGMCAVSSELPLKTLSPQVDEVGGSLLEFSARYYAVG